MCSSSVRNGLGQGHLKILAKQYCAFLQAPIRRKIFWCGDCFRQKCVRLVGVWAHTAPVAGVGMQDHQ